MRPENIDRAKDLNDRWDIVKRARHMLRADTAVYVTVKPAAGPEVIVPVTVEQARVVLDEKETELKKRLAVIGVDVE